MLVRGLDSAGREYGAADRAAGFSIIARYLAGAYAMGASEVAEITAAQCWLLSIWEIGAQSALGGRSAGRSDALHAVVAALEIHQPRDTTLMATCDFDPTVEQLPIVKAYFGGFADVARSHRFLSGAYGGTSVMLATKDIVDVRWQAAGWSNGVDVPGVQMRQTLQQADVGGVVEDVDVVLDVAHLGAWNLDGPYRDGAPNPRPAAPAPVAPSPGGTYVLTDFAIPIGPSGQGAVTTAIPVDAVAAVTPRFGTGPNLAGSVGFEADASGNAVLAAKGWAAGSLTVRVARNG